MFRDFVNAGALFNEKIPAKILSSLFIRRFSGYCKKKSPSFDNAIITIYPLEIWRVMAQQKGVGKFGRGRRAMMLQVGKKGRFTGRIYV